MKRTSLKAWCSTSLMNDQRRAATPQKVCPSRMFDGIDIVTYFTHNKKDLFVDCVENGGFSHCQQFYLMQFDSMRKMCQTFKRQKCNAFSTPFKVDIHNKGYTGTTLSLQLSFLLLVGMME